MNPFVALVAACFGAVVIVDQLAKNLKPLAQSDMVGHAWDLIRTNPGGGKWAHRTGPDGERPYKVPIVATDRTMLVPEHGPNTKVWEWPATGTNLGLRLLAQRWKSTLTLAQRGDEDWRCSPFLYVLETGWDRFCFCSNTGNRKVRPGWDGSSAFVYTANPMAEGVYLLLDAGGSIDFYPAYSSFRASFIDEKRFFSRGAYVGVIDAYKRGGLDGLIAARAQMLRAGYSPGSDPTAECTAYWNRMSAALGADWTR